MWGFNYHKEKCNSNGFNFVEDPYCVSLTGLGSMMGFSKSKNTNRKILSALETLRKVGLIDFEDGYYYKTLENGQITHFYKINNVYWKSAVQESLAEWASRDPEIATADEVLFDIVDRELKEDNVEQPTKEIKQENKSTRRLSDYSIDYYNIRAGQSPLSYFGSESYDLVKLLYNSIKSYLQEGEIANFEVTEQLRQVCIELFDYDYCDELVGKG